MKKPELRHALAWYKARCEELATALEQLITDWDAVGNYEPVPDAINTDEHWDAARTAIANLKADQR